MKGCRRKLGVEHRDRLSGHRHEIVRDDVGNLRACFEETGVAHVISAIAGSATAMCSATDIGSAI